MKFERDARPERPGRQRMPNKARRKSPIRYRRSLRNQPNQLNLEKYRQLKYRRRSRMDFERQKDMEIHNSPFHRRWRWPLPRNHRYFPVQNAKR